MNSFKFFFLAMAFVVMGHIAAIPMAEHDESAADERQGITGNPIPLGTTEKYESAADERQGITGNPIPLGTTEKDESSADERQTTLGCIQYHWFGKTCRLCFWCIRSGNISRCYWATYCA